MNITITNWRDKMDQIKPVIKEGGTVDYYQWGTNCKVLNMSVVSCNLMLFEFDVENEATDGGTGYGARDVFWEGYVCEPGNLNRE